MNYTIITLGALLSSTDETIRRNATAILKRLQSEGVEVVYDLPCPYYPNEKVLPDENGMCSLCGKHRA